MAFTTNTKIVKGGTYHFYLTPDMNIFEFSLSQAFISGTKSSSLDFEGNMFDVNYCREGTDPE